ncbi:MAG TPA: exonuclease domain-containing protein [Patescibacteria group bacterium]
MLPQKLAFIDTETTGLSVRHDRIIEIGIVRVEDGKIVAKYKSLINPQMHISPFITNLTNITPEELENAPTFYQIKNDIYEMLNGAVFVAHNVRFDYGFLKSEFSRVEMNFSLRHFCTAKLSRSLFPIHKHHNLDSIIDRFGLKVKNRHRAYDDAKVLWDFYKKLQKSIDLKVLEKHVNYGLRHPSRPNKLSDSQFENLPESPGVYIFYGENHVPLYVGKSVNIRDRVLSHFSNDYRESREMHLSRQVEEIETIKTGGELGALLKESQLIKSMQPLYNKKLRNSRRVIVLKKKSSKGTYDTHFLEEIMDISADETEDILGTFRSKLQAKEFLQKIVKEFSLCAKLVGLEKTKSACFGYRLGTCHGACIGRENPLSYNSRCIIAFSKNKIKPWPFDGPIVISEQEDFGDIKDFFVVDKWCLLGKKSVKSENEDFFDKKDYRFDMDTYKILISFLKDSKNQKLIKQIPKESFDNFSQNSIIG